MNFSVFYIVETLYLGEIMMGMSTSSHLALVQDIARSVASIICIM